MSYTFQYYECFVIINIDSICNFCVVFTMLALAKLAIC